MAAIRTVYGHPKNGRGRGRLGCLKMTLHWPNFAAIERKSVRTLKNGYIFELIRPVYRHLHSWLHQSYCPGQLGPSRMLFKRDYRNFAADGWTMAGEPPHPHDWNSNMNTAEGKQNLIHTGAPSLLFPLMFISAQAASSPCRFCHSCVGHVYFHTPDNTAIKQLSSPWGCLNRMRSHYLPAYTTAYIRVPYIHIHTAFLLYSSFRAVLSMIYQERTTEEKEKKKKLWICAEQGCY